METYKLINFFIKRYTDCGHTLIRHIEKDNVHIFTFMDNHLHKQFERYRSYKELQEIYNLFN